MSYAKYDDPTKTVDQSQDKVYDAFKDDAFRRALIGVSNRVCGGTNGTGHVPTLAQLATGSTGGVQIGNQVSAVINGELGTIVAQDNIELPSGTQAASTWVKYLVSASFATSGTITAGNEGTSSTHAHLPDLPDGHVALGYVEYHSNTTQGFVRTNNVLTGVGTTVATAGTVVEFQDLVCMPYSLTP